MLDSVAETDDELMMKYLEGEELTEEEIKAAIRKATIALRNYSSSLRFFLQR